MSPSDEGGCEQLWMIPFCECRWLAYWTQGGGLSVAINQGGVRRETNHIETVDSGSALPSRPSSRQHEFSLL